MVLAPWPSISNEQQRAKLQEKNPKQWWDWSTKKPQGDPRSHSAQGMCGAEDIQDRRRSRDPGGFLGVMALLEQEGLGLRWRLLLTCLACACAGMCYVAHGVTRKVRVERAEERLPAISICFELWLCLFSFLQRLFTLLWHLKRNQAG